MTAKTVTWIGIAGAAVTAVLSLQPLMGRGNTEIYLAFFISPLLAVFVLMAMAGLHRQRWAHKERAASRPRTGTAPRP